MMPASWAAMRQQNAVLNIIKKWKIMDWKTLSYDDPEAKPCDLGEFFPSFIAIGINIA